jgi:signal transduction histidine kinase
VGTLAAYPRHMGTGPTGISAAVRDRLRPGPRARLVLDVALAVVLGGFAFADALTSSDYPSPGPASAVLMGGAGLALALRRVRPLLGFLLSMGLMSACAVVFGPYQAGSSVLIALVAGFSAMAYGVGWRVFASVTVLFAVVDNRGPMPEALGGMAFVIVLLGAAGVGGALLRRTRELSAANVALRELVQLESASTTQAAVDDERSRVARELHDILSHSLGVIVLQTGAAEHAWDADPDRAREAVQAARRTSLEAIDQLRALLAAVHDDPSSDRAPIPTIDDLPALAARTTDAGFRVDLDVMGVPRPLPPQVQASVYRITQEGIANAMKHSGAKGCRIRLDYREDEIVVDIDDDGGGSAGGVGSRRGLAGIRERAALFGGSAEAGPRDAGGWRLRVEFPS